MNEKIAVAYARFSSDKQNQTSIEVQIGKIEEFCKASKLILIEKYIDEAQSGTNDHRKSFQKMIKDSENGLFSYIVVHRNDRWARNTEDAMYYKKMLKQRNVEILSVIENFDNKTPEGGFFNLVSMGMAELYSKKLARESWDGILACAKQCKVIGGVPPYGYQIVGQGKSKRYAVVPQQAKIIREMFNQVAIGNSYTGTIKHLFEQNLIDEKFNTSCLTDKLRNPKYKGEYVFNQQVHRTPDNKKMRHKYKDESEIIRIPNGFPRIVCDEVFDKVQKILDGRKIRRFVKNESKYLLQQLIKCGECGKAVVGNFTYNYNKSNVRLFYECCSRSNELCCCHRISMPPLDNYILVLLKNIFFKIENAKWIKNLIQKAVFNKTSENNAEIERNIQKAIEIENNITLKNKSMIENQHSSVLLEFLNEELKEYINEKKQIEIKNMELKKEIQKIQKIVSIEQIRKTIRNSKEKLTTIILVEKRNLLKRLIHQILLYKDRVIVRLNLWWYINPISTNEFADELILDIEESRDFLKTYKFDVSKVVIENLKITEMSKLGKI